MTTCKNKHSECPGSKRPWKSGRLPWRVIDVDHMCLYTSKPGEKAFYATLSYCWGGNQEFKTTKETFYSITQELPYKSLPKTIQDAFLVTQQVGLRYLWIDALCIIQDSESDVASWLAIMDDVYSECTVCIGAATAKSVKEGFLTPRPLPSAMKLPFDWGGRIKGHVWIPPPLLNPPIREPLSTRVWTSRSYPWRRELLCMLPMDSSGATLLPFARRSQKITSAPFQSQSFFQTSFIGGSFSQVDRRVA